MCKFQSLRIFFVFILFLSNRFGTAQFYETGQDPASTKWMQIHTEHFQVIFPKDFYTQANRFANTIESVYKSSSAGLNHQPTKVPVIFHTQSVLSNGYVVWAPKRMELIAMPPQDGYANDWLNQLALHELRHVIQVDKLNQGFTRFLSYPFGQMAPGAMTGFLPLWFVEGDAVVNETAHSKSGRGRDPSFEMQVKAIELDRGKRLSYDQSYLGSYKNFVPSYYHYGYYMAAYGHLKYGKNFWDGTLNNVGKRPFTLAPFFFGMKKGANESKVSLYNACFDTLNLAWDQGAKTTTYLEGERIQSKTWKHYTSYQYPVYSSKRESMFAVRSGIDDITRFVEITQEGEKILHTPGQYYQSRPAVGEKFIAWEEVRPDPRWEQRSFSEIKILNRETGATSRLKTKAKHFSPAFNSDERLLAVIANDLNYQSELEIYHRQAGIKSFGLKHPLSEQLSNPCWVNDSLIVLVSYSENGKKLNLVNIESKNWETIYGPVFDNLQEPAYWKGQILFNHPIDGTNNIYALDIKTRDLKKITSSRHGAFHPSVNLTKDELYFSSYTVNGYRLRSLELNSDSWQPAAKNTKKTNIWADSLAARTTINTQIDTIQVIPLPAKKYSKIRNTFNLHSWSPFYIDLDNVNGNTSGEFPVYPGVSLFSQNKLSTVNTYLNYYYDGYHHFKPQFELKAWYPILTLSADIGGSRGYQSVSGINPPSDTLSTRYELSAKISLPLNFSYGKFNLYVQPYFKYSYVNNYRLDLDGDSYMFKKGTPFSEYSLSASHILKKSKREIKPRWGQSIFLSQTYRIPFPAEFKDHFLALVTLYFPGMVRNHSLYYTQSYETYYNRIATPRGYSRPSAKLFDYNKLSVNYTLPLFYPDWSLGPVAYLKRFYVNFFYDYARYNTYQGESIKYKYTDEMASVGLELRVDLHMARFIFPVTPGIRFSYRLTDNIMPMPELFWDFSIGSF